MIFIELGNVRNSHRISFLAASVPVIHPFHFCKEKNKETTAQETRKINSLDSHKTMRTDFFKVSKTEFK